MVLREILDELELIKSYLTAPDHRVERHGLVLFGILIGRLSVYVQAEEEFAEAEAEEMEPEGAA